MIGLDSVKSIEIPVPNKYLTSLRVIEDDIEINDSVTIRHLFNPRRVIVESELPLNGFIEIM